MEAFKILRDKVVGQDVHLLWKEQLIDEEFVKRLLKVGFDLLEHNQGNQKATVDLKDVIFDLL